MNATEPGPGLRQRAGCWLHERWQTELVVRAPWLARRLGVTWLDLCNRHERLDADVATGGRICRWRDSSPLTVARLDPDVGARLMHHCLQNWPIEFADDLPCEPASEPEVSVILCVRGTGRLPQFRACLASLRAQRSVACEVIVVEQGPEPEFREVIPAGVHYLHQRAPTEMPFNKSWAFNAGAKVARGRWLALHDADMVVPVRFAAAVAERLAAGLDAVRFSRLIFYLDRATSERVQSARSLESVDAVGLVVQNTPIPIAVGRDVYLRIGGHDESFYGWGGEDNEFLDRLRTTRLSEGGFVPIVHLWHAEAPNRSGDRNEKLMRARYAVPAEERIRELTKRPFGGPAPAPGVAPASGLL